MVCCKKQKLVIWGAGRWFNDTLSSIRTEMVDIVCVIDNCVNNIDVYDVHKSDYLHNVTFDYLIITVKYSNGILEECKWLNIPDNKIIVFWNDELLSNFDNIEFIDYIKRENYMLKRQIIILNKRILNSRFEYGDGGQPTVISGIECLSQIIENNYSLCRFGDGEFEIMRDKERPWFQTPNVSLKKRLFEVINSNNKAILIAIADNFGNLDKYTENAADAIRDYVKDSRDDIMMMLDKKRIYYDAYLSRPYLMYKDKAYSKTIFSLFKKLFLNRKLVIVEGEESRIGIGNDFFNSASNIKRMICPSSNAFDYYDDILEAVAVNADLDDLILISLGPTATVLAYDLALLGYQAIDIGQVDNEYEWSLIEATERMPIKGKAVSELNYWHSPLGIVSEDYYNQIVWKYL